jgi:hypothetical protein
LTKEPIVVGDRQSANIEVDHFARGASNDQGYLNSVKRVPLAAAMKASLAMSPVVIVQGAMVWPFVQGIVEEIGAARVRRVYLKRMKWSNPDRWHDGSQFLEAAAPRHLVEYSNSIDRYHRDHQPWRGADLILERIEAEGRTISDHVVGPRVMASQRKKGGGCWDQGALSRLHRPRARETVPAPPIALEPSGPRSTGGRAKTHRRGSDDWRR